MAKVTDSESQSQIERTMTGLMNVSSSIEEDELKPDIKENVEDSVSSGIENGVNMSSETSFECEQGAIITLIDDSTVQEKQEMVDYDISFIHQIGSISAVSSIEEDDLKPEIGEKGADSFSSGFENGVKMNSETSFEFEQGGKITVIDDSTVQEKQEACLNIMEYQEMSSDVLESVIKAQNDVQSVIADDNFVALNGMKDNFVDDNFIVVEMKESVEKIPKSISQSQNLVEVSNVSRRSENNWDCLENQGEILKDITEIRERQGNDEKMEISELKEMQEKYDERVQCSLKNNEKPANFPPSISKTGNGCERKENGKKRAGSCSENIKQEMVGNKEICSKRNGKGGMKKFTETKGKQNMLSILAEARNLCQKKADGCKRSYSRNELEALRFLNGNEQRQIWKEIYTGLGPIVAKELNNMAESRNQNRNGANGRNGRNTILHQHAGKQKVNAPILGDNSSQNVEHNLEENILGEAHNFEEVNPWDVVRDDHKYIEEEEFEDDEIYDDEYDNIKKPAFCVEGDPDFDSGPPQDGLEYLRRVRWEAAQIPNVKVAQLDRSKLNKEQTVYMPDIPDIAKCPQHLQQSKQWEDEFLTDFSELRLALSHLEGSKSFPHITVAEVDDTSRSSHDPTLSLILGMDSVSRVSMLKRCIKSLETKSSLCRNDCAWIFALCAAVDIPLHAETTAFIRSLLRKCASWRAEKLESDDDEVVMLNMLVTISGRYFGQLD